MENESIFCINCGTQNDLGTKFCYKCGSLIKNASSSNSSNFISLNCPNCGGKLEVTPDIDRFTCKYCGNEHLVKRNGNNISLTPIVEGMKRVEQKFDHILNGSDRMAAEQTIQRLKAEMADLQRLYSEKKASLSLAEKNFGNNVNYSKEDFTDKSKFGKKNTTYGILLCLPIPIVFTILGTLSDTRLNSSFLSTLFAMLMIFSFLTGIVLIIVGSVTKSKTNKQLKAIKNGEILRNLGSEIVQIEDQLKDYKKRLEDLNRYTTERSRDQV
jgi:hypothetical protein